MKQDKKNRIFIGIGIILMLSLLFGVCAAIAAFIGFIRTSDPEVAAAIIATAGTILFGIFAHVAERFVAKNRDIAEAHRTKKTECYSKFLKTFVDYTHRMPATEQNPTKAKKLEEDMITFLRDFTADAVLWASPKVLLAYERFRISATTDPTRSLSNFDEILRAIRADLGHKDSELKKGDLMKMFLKDPQEFDEKVGK